MKRHGIPKLFAYVWGDWHSVIDVARKHKSDELRDILLDQKPYDEDDAEYKQYRISAKSTAELVAIYRAFHDEAKLRCAFAFEWESDDKAVSMWMCSGDGYGKNEPHCSLHSKDMASDHEAAIRTAIKTLEEAVK